MRKTVAIIGEGITEKYYIESLKGMSPFTAFPMELGKKASSLPKLRKDIENAIHQGYDQIFCLIDMDGKQNGKSKADYDTLKRKFHRKKFGSEKKGLQSEVIFIETERCTELWFLFHFTKSAITREFTSYKALEDEFHRYRPSYEKTDKYFRSVGNLHQELTAKRVPLGSLKQAINNAKSSVESKIRDERNYTYSEMHLLIEALSIPLD
jgi:hypothetical protein